MPMPRRRAAALTLAVVTVVAILAGCGEDDRKPNAETYLPQTSPDNVLLNFAKAWNERNIDEYAKLLAVDYQFYFDGQTRMAKGLPVYWTRLQDSTQVDRLFNSSQVSDITLVMNWTPNSWKPDTRPGHERWFYIDVLDLLLDVDLAPTSENPDGVTYRVEDQQQRFYFRKGRTEADTLATSTTANLYYLVQWIDYGVPAIHGPGAGSEATANLETWGAVKALFR